MLLVSAVALTCQAEKIPIVIKKLNKALGLSPESKDVWNLLEFDDIANKVENIGDGVDDNAAKIATICKLPQNKFSKKFVKKIRPQGTSKNLHQLTPSNTKVKRKMGSFCQEQSRF